MRRRIQLIVIAVLIASGAYVVSQTAYAATTVVVDSVGDSADVDLLDGICANASGTCTLRAAIETLNEEGPDTTPHQIHFNIAGSGPFTITIASPLPVITVPVVINGATQTGASCPTGNAPANLMIILDGSSAGTREDGLVLGAGSDGSTVQGLVIGNFDDDGIDIDSDSNRVRCNHIGVHADGVSPMGNGTTGVFVGGDQNVVGGSNAHAARNVISANGRPLQLYGSDNLVVNNFMGTTADGMVALGNESGIPVALDDNTVGGSSPLERNVISGNDGYAIYIGQADNTRILGNYIGVARDGLTPLPNGRYGIHIYGSAADNVIGGTGTGEGNVIAHHGGPGVELYATGSLIPERNAIRGNAIYDNEELGIDLVGESNGGQSYPVLTATVGSFIVAGALDSVANTTYEVDVYRNLSCDPSGYGEGRYFLDTWQVTTDGAGQATFELDLTGQVADGDVVTATATDLVGNSSEFSNCVTMEEIATPTPTATATGTPTPTWTPTPSPSATATAGPSPTSTPSLAPTATATVPPDETPEPEQPLRLIYLPAVLEQGHDHDSTARNSNQ